MPTACLQCRCRQVSPVDWEISGLTTLRSCQMGESFTLLKKTFIWPSAMAPTHENLLLWIETSQVPAAKLLCHPTVRASRLRPEIGRQKIFASWWLTVTELTCARSRRTQGLLNSSAAQTGAEMGNMCSMTNSETTAGIYGLTGSRLCFAAQSYLFSSRL